MSIRLLVVALDGVLAQLGFERQSRTWNRRSASLIDVVDVQVSKAGDEITVNVGVIDPEIYAICWGADPPRFVDEPSCTVRARIGRLIGDTDVWWPTGDPTTPQSVVEAVRVSAIPFLGRMHSHERMLEYLVASDVVRQRYPPPIIYLAILNQMLGNPQAACSIVADLKESTVGDWRVRVGEVSTRLGCS